MPQLSLPQGGRNRAPLPGVNPDESLRALRSMESISNVGGLTDEGLDIAQGYGQFAPSEGELMEAQRPTGGSVSRETIRKGAMGQIKKMLGLQQIEHGQKMDIAQEKTNAEAQARAAQNEAIAARQREMAEIQNAERNAAREDAQTFQAGQQQERLAAQANRPATSATTLPTEGMDKRLSESRQAFEGFSPLSRTYEWITGKPSGERTRYQSALESVLERSGSLGPLQEAVREAQDAGMSAADAIQDARNQGVTLNTHEQQYLQLVLGAGGGDKVSNKKLSDLVR